MTSTKVNAIEAGKYDSSLALAFKIARLFGQPIESTFPTDRRLEGGPKGMRGRPRGA